METLSTINESLQNLEGLDGYIVFDEDLRILDKNIDDSLVNENTGFTLKNVINTNSQVLEASESTILMTEKGAWYMSKIEEKYLLIMAGSRKPVDIPELIKLGGKIRDEMLRF